MTTLLRHDFATDLEIRSDGDGRTVHGIAVPFNSPTDIRDIFETYTEVFAPGAFAKTLAQRAGKVKFLWQHDRSSPLGCATELREDTVGLYAAFRVSKTQRGDEFLELAHDGALDAFSVGFVPIRNVQATKEGKLTITRAEVSLREVSAVTFPAYEGALMAGVRSLSDGDLVAAQSAFELLRAGKTLSSADSAVLKHVLSLVSAADNSVDEAQPLLATLLGVANPDADDAPSSTTLSKGMSYDLALRRAKMLGVTI